MSESTVVLGERYRDTISGLEGVATGRFNYLHGCERIMLEVVSHDGKEIKEHTFDAPRLEHVTPEGNTAVEMTTARPGGPRPTPTRSGTR